MNNMAVSTGQAPALGMEVHASWRPSGWGPSADYPVIPAVDLNLSEGSFFKGNVFNIWQQRRWVHAGFLRVDPEERGNGYGKKMVNALGCLANKYAFTQMHVGLASQYSLDIFADVFGDCTMEFHGLRSGGRDIREMMRGNPTEKLDIGIDEIRAELVALEKEEDDPEDRQLGFYTFINLGEFDASGLSLPVESLGEYVDLGAIG